jgi:hypothetical protein
MTLFDREPGTLPGNGLPCFKYAVKGTISSSQCCQEKLREKTLKPMPLEISASSIMELIQTGEKNYGEEDARFINSEQSYHYCLEHF